jgi:hypothetical protein
MHLCDKLLFPIGIRCNRTVTVRVVGYWKENGKLLAG